jgi:bifunctional pyridoxal-dependent enzyme with beta-cystathionase and maltose regulon repressor activities
MIIINTPHNPVGKVFTKYELETIAAIAEEYNLLVMADEVVSQSELFPLQKPSTFISTSTNVSYSMGWNTFASQTYPACGTAL